LKNFLRLRFAIVAAAVSLLLLVAGTIDGPMFAQGGGKAEPLRIEFRRGSTNATLTGRIKDQQEAEYVFSGRKGQKVAIKLISSPRRSSVFNLKGPEDVDLGLEFDANWDYSGTLPRSGDYLIVVARPTADPGLSSYRLTVTIH